MSQKISFDSNAGEDLEISILASEYEAPARIMNIKVTSEGLIIDFYDDAELSATSSMTYDEWFDWCQSIENRKSRR